MTIATTAPATKQVAINDIGSAEDFLAAVELTLKFFNDGDLIEGTVVKIDRDEVLLDVGYKTEGVIPSRELSIKHDVDPNEVVKVGDAVEALVLQKEDKEGRLILSKKRAQYERAWGDVEKIKETDGVVTGSVIEVVKGGLIVDIGLRGFLPASLIELRRVRDLTPYLGQEIEAKILELDKNRNNVVLSRRALLEQTQSESRTSFLNNLHKGQVRKGTVSSIVNFGAFVDLGGVDGLVHVSELSWKHIEHASEVVEVGQEVTVEILEVDLDRERVSLSLKATQEDPWQVFARTHAIGQVTPGKVTKLVPFGAFVRVADGIEGLVHISELSGKHVELAEQVVSVGEEVFVKVIDIDLERRRISLSLKQANESVDPNGTEFDPALYGMVTEYDENGEYKYPEGFDSRPTRGRKASTPSARSGSRSTPLLRLAGSSTRLPSPRPSRPRLPRRPRPAPPRARSRRTAPPAAPWPTTRRSPRFARSSRVADHLADSPVQPDRSAGPSPSGGGPFASRTDIGVGGRSMHTRVRAVRPRRLAPPADACGDDGCRGAGASDAPVALCEHHLASRRVGAIANTASPTCCRRRAASAGRGSASTIPRLALRRLRMAAWRTRRRRAASASCRRRLLPPVRRPGEDRHVLEPAPAAGRDLARRPAGVRARRSAARASPTRAVRRGALRPTEWFRLSERLRAHIDGVRGGVRTPGTRYLRWVSEAVALAARLSRAGSQRPQRHRALPEESHETSEDTMGFLDRLSAATTCAAGAARPAEHGTGARERPICPPHEPAAAERGRARDRALPLPAAHRAARDDRAGPRRGVLQAHRAAAPAGARGALRRTARLRAAAVVEPAGPGSRRYARRVHEPRLHGAHPRPQQGGRQGPGIRLDDRQLDPRHRGRLRHRLGDREFVHGARIRLDQGARDGSRTPRRRLGRRRRARQVRTRRATRLRMGRRRGWRHGRVRRLRRRLRVLTPRAAPMRVGIRYRRGMAVAAQQDHRAAVTADRSRARATPAG